MGHGLELVMFTNRAGRALWACDEAIQSAAVPTTGRPSATCCQRSQRHKYEQGRWFKSNPRLEPAAGRDGARRPSVVRPELPAGQGVELLKHPIVFVDEALVGGVVQSSRAGHLKAFRRDQEIAPQTNGSCAASTALPPLAFHVKHREQGERCTWCQGRGVGRASLTGEGGE